MDEAWWAPEVLDRDRLAPTVEPVLDRVLAARDRDTFPHALLLVGPPGLGRELCAVEIATLLVCGDLDRPFSDSPAARRVRAGRHPDVAAVLPTGRANRIKIEQIRGIVSAAAGRPFEGDRRVWILDGVEAGRLGAEAANAFLKTLEEPPPHVAFVLLASNPTATLPTIRSRCQRLLLPGPTAAAHCLGRDHPSPDLAPLGEEVGQWLEAAQTAIAAALDGEPRLVLRLAEQLPPDVNAFGIVAAAAIAVARQAPPAQVGELTRLAADLLRVESRARALNLHPGRQLTARLAAFHRDQS